MSLDFPTFKQEFLTLLDQGGSILWAMLGLTVLLYGLLASTWWAVLRVKSEIASIELKTASYERVKELNTEVSIFELDRLAWVERRLPVISVLIALAPLSGLLGTVSGMLNTFSGMATESSSKPIDSISSGISEALVTTQAGLLMAIPAALMYVMLRGRVEQVHGVLEQYECGKLAILKGGKHEP